MPLFRNHKKEPETAFFLFEKEIKKQVKKQNPNKKEYEINNIIAKLWIDSEPSKRLKYYELEKAKIRKTNNPIFNKSNVVI